MFPSGSKVNFKIYVEDFVGKNPSQYFTTKAFRQIIEFPAAKYSRMKAEMKNQQIFFYEENKFWQNEIQFVSELNKEDLDWDEKSVSQIQFSLETKNVEEIPQLNWFDWKNAVC